MTLTQWFIFFLIVQAVHFLGTWKLYIKAGRKAWEAAVPVYNAVILMKIINRPWWWVILLFLPIINLIMIPVVWVETIRSFGRNSTAETWLVLLTLGFYIYYLNYALNVEHIKERSLKPTTVAGEWVSSIVFAVVAATLVHTYFMQPFVIPTSSLEKTLLVGDFLFVSKFHYGARVPMTTVAFPMVHDTIPKLKIRSYLNKPQLPYLRLPGFQKVKRNDIVVFNWPADTVEQFFVKTDKYIRKPIDKKSNYVKRCVGIPGDTLEIRDGYIFINGEKSIMPDRAKPQYHYIVKSDKGVSTKTLFEAGSREFMRTFVGNFRSQEEYDAVAPYVYAIVKNDRMGNVTFVTESKGVPVEVLKKNGISLTEVSDFEREVNLTEEEAEKLKTFNGIQSVERRITPKGTRDGVFPNNRDYSWNLDNFGPLYIPQKGKTIDISVFNLPLYKKVIEEYEGNSLEVSGNQVLINGQPASTYTFKQDYFWMMGDNRHRSEDSRYWGFVPENHIVGKPVFIWLSIEGINDGLGNWKPRWERFFTTVGGSGKPVSYLSYFLVALAAWFVYAEIKKRRKKA